MKTRREPKRVIAMNRPDFKKAILLAGCMLALLPEGYAQKEKPVVDALPDEDASPFDEPRVANPWDKKVE
jgi:hypothetical protein